MTAIDGFKKIDAHIHFNSDRDNLLELADKYNFDLLTINTEVPDFPSITKQKKLAETYKKKSTVFLFHATTIDSENIFEDDWAERTIEKIIKDIKNGASGVKFWKNIGMSIQCDDDSFLMLDNNKFDPVFDFLEREKIPVLAHQGEPKNCWLPVNDMTVQSDRDYFSDHPQYHMYKHPEYPDYWDHINARDARLEKHPDLQFVGLHLASLEWSLDELSKRLDKFPNMAVDLAERISHLYYHTANNREFVIDFFKKYQNRIIYGTDIIDDPSMQPAKVLNDLQKRWKSHWEFLSTGQKMQSSQIDQPFYGLNLPDPILEKIYRFNAINWYDLNTR
ncbi:amidohydrolase family protein [Fodinibius sp. SL11]|uniref:amidohydrolase family protein n=1 Tax=Fodinibius sp. SL11 TaxID=3425690 RepID=UPI003F883562